MDKPNSDRQKVRDHYESHGIDMSIAVDQESILETPAKDSPAMTGESKEEVDYNSYK